MNRKAKAFVDEDESKYPLSDNFVEMALESMCFWLPKFVMEARKGNGDSYPPDSLYSLCCGLQRALKSNERADVNLFADSSFHKFRQILDSQMKILKATGKFEKKNADIITEEMEDRLWQLNILGDHNQQVLLDTTFFYIGLYFALRGGEEHRRLRHNPCQIALHENPTGLSFLVYTEDKSKTNQGGLVHRDRASKQVTHYENKDCPQRCLVRLFKLYNSKCPPDRPHNSFYLKPLKKPKGDVWYTKTPLGHNMLSKMISRMMASANIDGNFTNHSLRSTTTTRLFNAHVDE